MSIQLGITRLLSETRFHGLLRGRRIGLVAHEASVDERCRSTVDLLLARQEELGFRLTALFSPQHGFRGQDQDNMIETPHATFKGVPLYSLYSETRRPTAAMLADVDVVVVDLQDIGTRPPQPHRRRRHRGDDPRPRVPLVRRTLPHAHAPRPHHRRGRAVDERPPPAELRPAVRARGGDDDGPVPAARDRDPPPRPWGELLEKERADVADFARERKEFLLY